jgi:dehydrogluconokinase
LPGLSEGRLLTGFEDPGILPPSTSTRALEAVAIKLGPQGAYYRSQLDQGFVAAVPVAKVVDTVGAGDGFAVGLISALLENLSLAQAVQRGNWIGSRAVQSRGDMEGLPLRADLPRLAKSRLTRTDLHPLPAATKTTSSGATP